MRVLLHAIISLVGTIAEATFTGAKINLHRCADAKIRKHDVISIVVVVSSIAHDFSQRSELRQTDFRDAKLLSSRTVFRPMNSAAGAISQDDSRPVCVRVVRATSSLYSSFRIWFSKKWVSASP